MGISRKRAPDQKVIIYGSHVPETKFYHEKSCQSKKANVCYQVETISIPALCTTQVNKSCKFPSISLKDVRQNDLLFKSDQRQPIVMKSIPLVNSLHDFAAIWLKDSHLKVISSLFLPPIEIENKNPKELKSKCQETLLQACQETAVDYVNKKPANACPTRITRLFHFHDF